MKIQILQFRRARAFRVLEARTLGEQPSDASLAREIELAKTISDRLQRNDADIREVAPRTYLWARKPLARVSIAIVAAFLHAGIANQRAVAAPDVSTPKKAVQAFLEALQRNDMALANSLVIGTAEQVSVAKREHDLEAASSRLEIAKAKKFEGEERGKEEADKIRSRWANANEKIEQDEARVSTGWFGPVLALVRDGLGWKIDLSRSNSGLGADLAHQAGPAALSVLNEIAERIEKGYYKTEQEATKDLAAKFAAFADLKSTPSSVSQSSNDSSAKLQPAVSQPSPIAAEKLPEYTAAEARKHVGENATVLVRVDCIECVTGCYLSFGDCGGDATFFIHLPKDPAGPQLDVNKLKGTTLAVSGTIKHTTGKGVPFIDVQSTSQIVLPRESTSNELEEAIAQEGKLIEANSKDAKAYYRRGVAREKRAALQHLPADYRAAIDDYDQSLKLDASNLDALVHIGDCYAALQDYVAAKKAWDRAIEASPEAKELLKDSITKEHDRYVYAAIHDLDKLTNFEPKNAALHYRKANLYLMDHATDEANKNFQLAAELEPTNVVYGVKASHPITPSKRPLTVEELKDATIAAAVGLLGAGLTVAAMSDLEAAKAAKAQHERVKSIVEASGGTKIECPKCSGSGKIVDYRPNYSGGTNPYMWYSLESQQWENSHRASIDISQCERCGGTGVIDK